MRSSKAKAIRKQLRKAERSICAGPDTTLLNGVIISSKGRQAYQYIKKVSR